MKDKKEKPRRHPEQFNKSFIRRVYTIFKKIAILMIFFLLLLLNMWKGDD